MEAFTTDLNKVWKLEEQVGISISHPPCFPLGKGRKHSNTNAIILGVIVQKLTGRDLPA